jgi:hypothetical protein
MSITRIKIAIGLLLLAMISAAYANGISQSATPQLGGGIDWSFDGGISGHGSGGGPPPSSQNPLPIGIP